jgi:protein-L-isoaspartate O-methyltransferase
MKLSVELLDNHVKSAVINIGANNGYVEAFVAEGVLHLNVFNKEGDLVHDFGVTTADLRKNLGKQSTTPKFEPAQEHYED